MYFDWGNRPVNSTYAPASNPSTATLVADLDSTQLGTQNLIPGQELRVRVNWMIGADTNATWQLEACTSTALNAGNDIFYPKTPTAASAQFISYHTLLANYRLRARVFSTFTASASAYISAEVVT